MATAAKKTFILGVDIDVKKAHAGLSSLITSSKKLGASFAVMGAGITAMMKDQFDDYKELNDVFKSLGQNGSFAFKTINAAMSSEMTSASGVRNEIERLSKSMLEMKTLGYTNNTGFAMIGASMNDTMDTLLKKTQKTIQYLTNTGQTAKAKKLADVLGINELYYVLRESDDVFNKMSKNGIISRESLDKMQDVSKSWASMRTQFARAKMNIQMEMAPALSTMMKAMGDVITSEPLTTTIKIMSKSIGYLAAFFQKTPPSILSTILTAILVNKATSALGFKGLGKGFRQALLSFGKGTLSHLFGVMTAGLFLAFTSIKVPLLLFSGFIKSLPKFGLLKSLGLLVKGGFRSVIQTILSFGIMLLPHLIPIAIIGMGIMAILSIVRLIGKKFGLINTLADRGKHGTAHDMFVLMDDAAERRKLNGETAVAAEVGGYIDVMRALHKGAMMNKDERLANAQQYDTKHGRLAKTPTRFEENVEYYTKNGMKLNNGSQQLREKQAINNHLSKNNTTNQTTIINVSAQKVDENYIKKLQRERELSNYNNVRAG